MINNLPVKTLKHGDLTIEGYSRAAVQSYWRIPELKLGFDLGAQPWSFMGTETWFVTHGHLDHIAALPVYVARRRMMKMTPPVIYMPAETIEPMQKILRLFTRQEAVPGTFLMRQNDPPDDGLFVVESGKVTAQLPTDSGRIQRLQTMGPGSICGELELYLDTPRSADVVRDDRLSGD